MTSAQTHPSSAKKAYAAGKSHWKTELVASQVEMISGRRKKVYEAQQAADSLTAQAEAYGEAPPTEPIPASTEVTADLVDDEEDD